jgi:hypothetical protein
LYAICTEDQGMTTYEIMLYKDSTFFCDFGFGDVTWGTYRISNDTIRFNIDYWENNIICNEYKINYKEERMMPVGHKGACEKMYFRLIN